MALTVSAADPLLDTQFFGQLKVKFVDVTFDSSYASGGESLTARDLGLQEVLIVLAETAQDSDAYLVKYDKANAKLLCFVQAAGGDSVAGLAQASALDDLSGVTVRLMAMGY